ncbi:signal transducer and activator of transcription 6 isoform X2 [Eucyclogobius newberryi]|uniref:signal transducer and activator of transcription 6 isoform X2 n=1 Tax=Eucyclogobius newberryi TaxID=166745 RepID=UPI003B5A2821
MAQWSQMTQLFQYLSHDMVNDLYPSTFPIDVRHFLADWIEQQIWEDFEPGKTELEARAKYQLDQVINLLQIISEQNSSIVDKMKLRQISKTLVYCQTQPLEFGVMVRDILRKERYLLSNCPQFSCPQYPQKPSAPEITMDQLVNKVLEIQDIRQKIHVLQEELNLDREKFEAMAPQGSVAQNGMSPSSEDPQKNIRICIQQKEYNLHSMAMTRVQLLQECVQRLEQYQLDIISKLNTWCYEQHKAAIGHPFDDNLHPLQAGFEQLLEMNAKLRQEVYLVGDLTNLGLTEKLTSLLTVLVQSSLVIEKQPPQVIKTQSKFSASVRYLFGDKIAPGKPAMLKVQIINEPQARGLGQGGLPSDNVGELMNHTTILEHNSTTKSTSAAFRNMSIKKIKRAERKGSECVTEEKFALLFSGEIHVTGCDNPYSIYVISVPIVVIVHGSQDINAMATVLWDCAFAEPDRVLFMVPERVPWRQMCNMLNVKFTSEVNTQHSLNEYNLLFLAQKIFDKHDICDFSNLSVSWSQFNKETLPGRAFTFWQWFEGVIELTKKHLHSYWSDRLIFGFIGKQHLHVILKDRPGGTFLLRFSDSEIGAITIAYVAVHDNGVTKVQNIQPFGKKDLEISGLGNRIIDINYLTYLYPNIPKNVFKKYYIGPPKPAGSGYIPFQLVTVAQPSEMNRSSNENMIRPTQNTPESFSVDSNAAQSPVSMMAQYPPSCPEPIFMDPELMLNEQQVTFDMPNSPKMDFDDIGDFLSELKMDSASPL